MINQSPVRVDSAVATARAVRRGLAASVRGTNSSLAFRRSVETRDQMMTFDAATIDSSGVFLIGELERLDQRLHMPLLAYTWARDINLRSDVSIADETSSFTNSTFASSQGIAGSNKSWIAKDSTAMVGVSLDIGKTAQPLTLWGMQIGWTLPELQSAMKLGRPVDTQKLEGMQRKYQMDIDEQVYMGDSVLALNGLLNHSKLTNTGNAVTGGWSTATPAQILADVNAILYSVYSATGTSMMANKLLIAPPEYNILVSTLISSAGNISILEFVRRNNLVTASGGTLDIQPLKWLLGTGNNIGSIAGQGPAATDSMFAYVQEEDKVRFPLVPLQRTPLEYRGIHQLVSYYGRLGAVELVYPETAARRSNLG